MVRPMESSAGRVIYAFGPYRLDPAGRRLLLDGDPVVVTAKVLDVLIVLVEAQGAVVDREVLMDRVWPATAVVDANLTQTVSVLRKRLGDTAAEHRYVATVPGRGYQFTASVEVIREPPNRPAEAPATLAARGPETVARDTAAGDVGLSPAGDRRLRQGSPTVLHRRVLGGLAAAALVLVTLAVVGDRHDRADLADRGEWRGAEAPRSLAVLPFTVLTPERLDPTFGVGLSASLTSRLGGQAGLRVRSIQEVLAARSGPASPLDVAAAVRADLVVTGTLEEADGTVRVTSQLIDVEREHPVWSVRFDQPMTSLFAVEEQVAERLARELTLSVSGADGSSTTDGEAVRQMLLGRARLLERNREDYQQAAVHFERALERQPEYASALSQLALTHALLASNGNGRGGSRELLSRAAVEAHRALDQAPDLAEAHVALGLVAMNGEYAWTAAVGELRRAVDLDPAGTPGRYYLAIALMLAGDEEGAWREAQAFGHPRPAVPPQVELYDRFSYGLIASFLGRLGEAHDALGRALEIGPDRGGIRMHYALVLDAMGRHDEALEELDRAVLQYWSSSQATATLANYLGRSSDPDDRARGRRILDALESEDQGSPGLTVSLAIAHAGVGSKAEAIRLLWQAHERREVLPILVQRDPRFDPLRSEPELERLLRAMRLSESGLRSGLGSS